MGLVTSTDMFKKAYEGKYAVGAFNVKIWKIIQASLKLHRKKRPFDFAGIRRPENTPIQFI